MHWGETENPIKRVGLINFFTIMKNLFIFFLCLPFLGLANDNHFNPKDVMVDFNYLCEVDFDSGFEIITSESNNEEIFSFKMINSGDILVAYKSEGVLKPTFFIKYNDDSIVYKDINNRLTTVIVSINDNKVQSVNYLEKNDSKMGLAVGCMGGSTANCIQIAWDACMQDTACSFTCALAGPSCPIAIATACAAHCNL